MTKPKLNIREMIRSGEIDTAKAGQLLSVHYYDNKNSILSDSDERALRETAKDVKLFNAYMGGGRELKEVEIMLIAMARETELANQRLAWIGAELKYTIETLYTPPRIVAVTNDKYEALGKEKRDKRLKRTYTLVTLYRILIENLIKYPEGKAEETALANLKEYPEDAQEGYLYGIDLIDPEGKGDVIEYWRGWTPYYNGDPNRPDTIDKLAEELPEAHTPVMERLKALYKAKKLSIDPESVPLNKYHETELKGSELAVMEGDIKHLSDLLNRPEHSLLDYYKDEGETERQADDRSIFEKYKQTYAILKNPERYKHKLKDGTLEYDNYLDRPFAYGARDEIKPSSMAYQLPLETIKNNRKTVRDNLYIVYVFTKWREKTGQLLGVNKLDNFKALTDNLDPTTILTTYELYRTLLLDQILRETYILPKYRDYTDEIVKLYAPLTDEELITERNINMTLIELQEARQDPESKLQELVTDNKYVAEALKSIEAMDIYTVKDSFYSVRDTLKPYIDEIARDE